MRSWGGLRDDSMDYRRTGVLIVPVLRRRSGARIRWSLLTLLVILLRGAQGQAAPEEIAGKVIGVSDGDTIRVLTDDKRTLVVRLNGIDSPELGQAFGQVARRHLSDLVFGKRVVVNWEKVDRFRRLVGTVSLDGADVGLDA